MNWNIIRLELAGTRDFPTGSVSRGFLLRLPLKADGMIDEVALAASPQKATVRHFWSTEPDERGQIVPVNGHWVIRCNGKPDRLVPDRFFGPSKQITVVETDGVALPFRVASIRRHG